MPMLFYDHEVFYNNDEAICHIYRTVVEIPGKLDPDVVLGPCDSLMNVIDDIFGVSTVLHVDCSEQSEQVECSVEIYGDDEKSVERAKRVYHNVINDALRNQTTSIEDVYILADHIKHDAESINETEENTPKDILTTARGKVIRPKTAGQIRYVNSIKSNTITFGLGPAGTGKTYLAMSMAVSALRWKAVSRIVLTRPVVEAGESLGYLPGTLEEKLNPYVRPLYDALYDMVGSQKADEYISKGVVEIAPLAFMRGRTLNDAFVILDEAQNTTPDQMKMFLTRLGFNSKFVITGDVSQRDISSTNGLESAEKVLSGVDDISFVKLGRNDIVRHSLVARIVDAYDSYNEM